MSCSIAIRASAILAAWLLCGSGGVGAGDPATPAAEKSDLAFSVRVLKVPPSRFDEALRSASARSQSTRYTCPDSIHLFVISEARNFGSDTLRFCGMIELQGGYGDSTPDFAPPDLPIERFLNSRRGPTLLILPRTMIPEEPFRCRSAVVAPGEMFADTLHFIYCTSEYGDYPGVLHLSGSFLIGEIGEKNEQATVVVEDAVEVKIPMP